VTDKASAGPPPQREPVAEQPPPADLSRSDYARTTSSSPASTSVIPTFRDEQPSPAAPVPAPVPVPQPAVEPVAESVLATGRIAGLRLVRVEPYSVTRLAFVVSVALMIVSVVAVAALWMVLAVFGVWGDINSSVASLLSDDAGTFDIKDYLGFGRMVGGTLVLSGINVILMTMLATIGAHLYNLAAALLGGVEATFRDD
jgi:hypothetical protein